MIIKEISKTSALSIVEIIGYLPNSFVSKTIINKSNGNINVLSFNDGIGINKKNVPFDVFVKIIDGKAKIKINGNSNSLQSGQGILIPANTPSVLLV